MLTRLIKNETLQTLQERFAALGRVSVCICTLDGEPMTEPTWGSPYSELIGSSSRGRKEFARSIRTVSRNLDTAEPAQCHEGMTLRALAIVHDNHALGAIVVGTRSTTHPTREEMRAIAAAYELDADRLVESVASIDPYKGGAPEAIHRFAAVLADTIATLYAQAERIERQYADLRTVHELSGLFSGTLDLQEILDMTVRRVVDVMPVKACGIRLLNEETGELAIRAVCNLSDEYLNKGPVILQENAIDASAFAGEAVYIEDAPNDPRSRYPENARREGIVSGLCLPMTFRGQTIGVIRVYTSKRYAFNDAEVSLLRSIGSQAASAIIHSRLYEDRAHAERFQRQVEVAGEIQRRMLPACPPRHPRLDFGSLCVPTLQVGGDFYDFIEQPDGALGVCIADVVGKGLPAALMMASLRSALRAFAQGSDGIDAVLAQVNRHTCRDTLVSEFATLVYCVISPDGRSMAYCNAGHPPPLLLRGDQLIELTTGGLVVGVVPDEVFPCETIAIREGDVLVMTTDGVMEAMDFGGCAYGLDRLRASIRRHCALDAQQLAQQILWDVRRFVGLADQSDDITIVVIKAAELPSGEDARAS